MAVFKPSEFAIINTDGHSDFEAENSLTLLDQSGKRLDLKLNYVYVLCLSKFTAPDFFISRYPGSGGAFKVQIFSPYIVINKTGVPFSIRSARSTRAGTQDVAGDTRPGTL